MAVRVSTAPKKKSTGVDDFFTGLSQALTGNPKTLSGLGRFVQASSAGALGQPIMDALGRANPSKPESPDAKQLTAAQKAAQAKHHATSGRADQDAVYANKAAAQADPQMTFADYLALAQQLSGGGEGGSASYDEARSQVQAQGSDADAKLAAMYQALQGKISGDDRGAVTSAYDQAAQSITANGDQAASATDAAYNSARDQQTAQLQALGIQGAGGGVTSQQAAADQAAAQAGIRRSEQSSANANSLNKGTALDYNTNIASATGMAGTEARATLAQQLQQRLAEIDSQQSSASGQNADDIWDRAAQLYGFGQKAEDTAYNRGQDDIQNQFDAARLQLSQAKAQGSQKTLQDQLDQTNQLRAVAQQAGITTEADFQTWLKNLRAGGAL